MITRNLVLICLILISCGKSDKVLLRLNLDESGHYKQKISFQTKGKLDILTKSLDFNLNKQSHILCQVKQKEEDLYRMAIYFDTLIIKMALNNQKKFEYQLGETSSKQAINDLPISIDLTDRSKLKRVSFEDEIEEVGVFLKDYFFNNHFDYIYSFYPEKPVEEGDQWTILSKVKNIALEYNFPLEFELISIDSDKARIKGQCRLADVTYSSYNALIDDKVKYKISINNQSDYLVDVNSGTILWADIQESVIGECILTEKKMDFEIPIPIQLSTRVKINY